MQTSSLDFYLASSEGYDMEEPRKAYRIKRIAGDDRDDLLLVRIDPPLIGQKYGLGARDIDCVILATRHVGDTLFPINKWPVAVHVARILVDHPEQRQLLHRSDLHEIAWAELYPTESAARAKRM